MVRRAVRASGELAARRPLLRPARQRARHGQGGRDRRELQLGRRSSAQHAVVRHGHLRGASARPDHAVRGHPSERARHLRGAGRAEDHRSSAPARDHGDRAAADPRLRAGPQSAAEGPAQLLGLQHARLLRGRAAAICRRIPRTRCASRCGACMRPGIEVILDVVYNHTAEGSELGPDAVVPRARQFELLPPRSRTIRAIASTTPAPATRSTCRMRACCRW